MVNMNRLSTKDRSQIIGLMIEGMSIRAISRTTGASKNTIVKLLRDAGRACFDYQDKALRNLPCQRLQLDEIWSFVYAKAKNVPAPMPDRKDVGDVWTWTALDADSKLIVSWMVGDRTTHTARAFVGDLTERLAHRVQITTDGHVPYPRAVDEAFGIDVDYAMSDKIYATPTDAEKRYSPRVCVGAKRKAIVGHPDQKHISTSFAERQNSTMRMSLRRFTRLTNAFSKRLVNHVYALAIYFMHYNFVRIHQTTRVTPAMAANVTEKLWSIEDIIRVVDEWEVATKNV